MRKLLLGLFLLCFPLMVLASPVSKTLLDITLDADPTEATSSSLNIADWTNPTLYVTYDETETGNAIVLVMTLQVSMDGTSWVATSFFDLGGGPVTFQTSEEFSTDTNYIAWLETMNYPFVRVIVRGSTTDADDVIDLEIRLLGTK